MTAAAMPQGTMATLKPQSPLAKATSLVTQMERDWARKKDRAKDIEAFVTPYSTNVEQTTKRYEDVALNVLDETVFEARTTLQAFLLTGITNPSQRWERWAIMDPQLAESAAVKEWLHTANDRRDTIKHRSNFYDVMPWVYGEWPAHGTTLVLIEEDETDLFRYVPLGIGSYAIADNHRGDVIAVSRRLQMTVRQVVERFALRPDGTVDQSKLSLRIRQAVEKGALGDNVEIIHLACPNDQHNPIKQTPAHFAYASYYWEASAQEQDGMGGFLAKEGYREWPFMVYRWGHIPGDPWGADSPGILTLAAVKSLQQMESDKLMAAETLVKPPLVVPPGLTIANLLPAARNAVETNSRTQVGPLHKTEAVAVQIMGMEQQVLRERIYSLWHTRTIRSLNQNPYQTTAAKTAREVEEISNERLQVLGLILEAANSALRMASDREFAIMLRAGVLPPVPPELSGQALAVEFTSMLAMAQKSVGRKDLVEFGMWVAEMARTTEDPAFMRKMDSEQLVDEVAQRSGLPPRVVRTDDQTAAIRAGEQAAAAEQAKVEQAAMEAKAAKDLAATPMGGDTALDRIVQAGAA